MGYRQPDKHKRPDLWMKPIGYNALTYESGREEWTCWFLGRDNNNTLARWTARPIDPDIEEHGSYLYQLKYIEAYYTKTSMGAEHSNFEFLDTEQQWTLLLDPKR